jgi:hypothetical protein
LEGAVKGIEVVVGDDEGIVGDALRNASARDLGAIASRENATSRRDEHRIAVTVVAAFELEDDVTPREAACKADRSHDGFGARAHEANFVNARAKVDKLFREVDFVRGCNAKGRSTTGDVCDKVSNFIIPMTKDHRPPRATTVNDVASIRSVDGMVFAIVDVDGCATHSIEGADRGINASWHDGISTLEERIVDGLHGYSPFW